MKPAQPQLQKLSSRQVHTLCSCRGLLAVHHRSACTHALRGTITLSTAHRHIMCACCDCTGLHRLHQASAGCCRHRSFTAGAYPASEHCRALHPPTQPRVTASRVHHRVCHKLREHQGVRRQWGQQNGSCRRLSQQLRSACGSGCGCGGCSCGGGFLVREEVSTGLLAVVRAARHRDVHALSAEYHCLASWFTAGLMCKGTHTRTCQDLVCAGEFLHFSSVADGHCFTAFIGHCGMQEPSLDSPMHGAEQGMILSRSRRQTLSFSHLC